MFSRTRVVICTLVIVFISPLTASVPASANPFPPIAEDVKKAYVEMGDSPSRFGFQEKHLGGAKATVKRALDFVGKAHKACANGTCEGKCLHLAAKIWGYEYSGSPTALAHWRLLSQKGWTRSDREPPVGALVFWDISWSGHVAVYVGDGMVVSNWRGDKGHGVYLLPIDTFENEWSSATYLGWSPPYFLGTSLITN